MSNVERIFLKKLVTIIGFFLIIISLLSLRSLPINGYIVDIYSILPYSFLISIIICYFIGSTLVFWDKRKIGVLILIFTHLSILLIPFMLGYYSMGRADDMSYIGEYQQITVSGNIGPWNIYPATHIIGSSITLITGIPVNNTSFLIPITFSFLFIFGLILFSKELIQNKLILSIAIPTSFILYLGPYNFLNVPHALFFAMMPLFCYLSVKCVKENSKALSGLLVLLIILIPFTHPFIVFFVFCFTLIYLTPNWLNKRVELAPKVNMYLLLLIASFFSWFLYQGGLLQKFNTRYTQYTEEISVPTYVSTTEKLVKINLDLLDYFKLLNFYYGRYYIPAIIIFISLFIIIKNRNKIDHLLLSKYKYLLILYLSFFVIQIILLLNPIITHQPDRLTNLNFIVIAQVPLFAYSLYIVIFSNLPKKEAIFTTLLIITLIWGISLFGCLDSPNIFKTNVALTNNEVNGMRWFYDYEETEIIGTPFQQISRFGDLFGERGLHTEKIIKLPDHFGYGEEWREFSQINVEKGKKMDIILFEIDELLYQEVPGYKNVGRYTKKDFDWFKNDYSVEKIFDSLNTEIYRSS
ncbi:MAG: hypothetical protein BWX87_02447 [Bacteroidetes bacterium ADurb.Bin123]|nr:MAG: hypothetical protein BWX87_02447 [Bacteroidetes bacterium ADurb.Bin123]